MALPNLPFTRELRDQIYGYLLNSAYTRVIRSDQDCDDDEEHHTLQAYKFETAILTVNREIHDEAEEYLYKNNVFIVASFEWPRFATGPFGGMAWVPIVNAKKVSRMKHHTMRLHFTPTLDVRTSTPGYRAGGKIPIQSFLILKEDFHTFCNTMRYHVGFLPGFAIVIADQGPPLVTGMGGIMPNSHKAVTPASIKVQLRDTPFRTPDDVFQRDLLDKISKISCASMRVSVTGDLRIQDTDYIHRLKEAMGPVLLSKQAAMWANYEIPCDAKYVADKTAHSGELKLASTLYASIFGQICEIYNFHGDPAHSSLVTWKSLEALRLDVLCTLGYLQIKLRYMTDLVMTESLLATWLWEEWPAFPMDEHSGNLALAHIQHLLILCRLYLLDLPKSKSKNRAQYVDETTKLLSGLEDTPHVLHDLTVLKEASSSNEPASKHLPIDKCSACILPLPCISFHRDSVVPKPPVHFVGRQNLNALHHLDRSTKNEIIVVQKMYGQPITHWE